MNTWGHILEKSLDSRLNECYFIRVIQPDN